jgi:hypothetical protein
MVNLRLPDIGLKTHYEPQQDAFEYRHHIRHKEKPTRQIHETIKNTFELLDLLQDTQGGAFARYISRKDDSVIAEFA